MDISHLYIPRPQLSVDEDQAQILKTFKEVVEKGKTGVKLLNYYQGLPLFFPAQIVEVDHGMLDLDIHPQQAVAIERDRYTFIRSDAFPHDIGAHVQYINVSRRTVTLSRLFFVDIMADHRQALRLKLAPPTDAAFDLNGEKVGGQLYDLSMGGAAISVDRLPECTDGFETKLQFLIPNIIQNTHTIVHVPAQHVGTTEQGECHICKFSITPDKTVEQLISQYIFQRQVEIIRFLKDEAI